MNMYQDNKFHWGFVFSYTLAFKKNLYVHMERHNFESYSLLSRREEAYFNCNDCEEIIDSL